MKNTISNIFLPADTWVNIYLASAVVAAGIAIGDRLSFTKIEGKIDLSFIATKPDSRNGFTPLQKGFEISNSLGSLGAWAISRGASGLINVSANVTAEMPDGLYSGLRAITMQSYTEANSKNGVEHEGSTLLLAVGGGASNDTIFLTGSLPVSLKGRVIGFTGDGVTAEIFTGPAYTGGSPVPYQNASDINPVTGLSQIIVGATVSDDGTLAFAPEHLIGNTSVQGKGSTGAVVGREKLLKPNTAYLFRITSLDAAAQDVSSLLTWYEGELDLPL
jgi:hypothetical protein